MREPEQEKSMTDRYSIISAADAAFDEKDYDSALSLYRQALNLASGDPEALTGEALSALHAGNPLEAAALFENLLPLMPESDQLSYLYAEALNRAGRQEEAQTRLELLLEKNPGYADAWNRLGSIWLGQGKNEDANRCFRTALEKDPNHVEALCNMGLMMIKFCHFDDAMTLLKRALTIEPDNILALNNMGRTCKMQGRHQEAIDWYRRGMEVDEGRTFIIDNYLFALSYCDDMDPGFVAREHRRLARQYLPKEPVPSLEICPAVGRKLRVAYLSGDFYTHSVAYFVEPLLQNHDYARFEIYCYSVGSSFDATTERIRKLPCIWRDMSGMPPEAIAMELRNDRIDILIDLAGHTADNRLQLFAARTSPVQICWIGYPNTTGLPQMDYYISDDLCDPEGMTEHLFSETLWRLPRVFCCYLPPMEFPAVYESPSVAAGHVTFGSFNNFAKVTDRQLEVWSRILNMAPDSKLYLKSMALGDRSVQDSVLDRLMRHGIDPARVRQRVVTSTPLEHLAEYGRVDIALDTFPYHGTTTTCEALWMGTPVIARAGNTHASRVGVSLLTTVGCPELVAETEEDYINKAVTLAFDPARLKEYRSRLRLMMANSPLMDAAGVTREVEAAYEAMFAAACRKAGLC